MVSIKMIAEELCRKYETRNPFDLAASLGIIVLHEPLGEIQGYYNRCYQQKFIHINDALSGDAACFTCAHELGHTILHPRINTPFLRKNTLFSVDKLELQANHFALDFLYDDNELQIYLRQSISASAAFMGVPIPLAEYRMSTVEPTLWSQFE